ncbi:MAG: two-component system, cell cycle sensor histidine kinase and response regulator CckA [Pyrinomonadaceae bacterium]|nr:two-component system, cell cycle sensor histidine kinase and response regulator CckA [Pyrinomonadaceae bacterium]
MKERFFLDREQNILFINFADFRIESRAQVDEMAQLVREAVAANGGRVYSVVNYEGTEIAPHIVDYYGERIKELQDRYSVSTVRYSSSGLTRSVLRYLGAAVDLESNIFTTRDEAIRAIRELESRNPTRTDLRGALLSRLLTARHSLLVKLLPAWLIALTLIVAAYLWAAASAANDASQLRVIQTISLVAFASLACAAAATCACVYRFVIKPLRRMERATRSFVGGGGAFEAVEAQGRDEVGQLAAGLNDAARQLRRDIARLNGLYHISLMMGTGTEVSRICELLTGKIARLLEADMCVILLHDEREHIIYAQLPAHGVSDEHVRSLRSNLNNRDERSIAGWVFATGEPYLTNDIAADALISRTAAQLIGARSMLAVPLQVGDRALGVLEVMNKEGGFVEDDKRLVTIFAAQAAHLLANAQLFERLRDSEERHRQIFESALDGLYRATPNGRFVTLNPALWAMLGYANADELTDANLVADVFADAATGARLLAELATRGQVLDVECELRRKSGEPLPARLSARVVTDKASGEVYHLGIVRNVAEQKRLSEQLKISEQLAVVGELVAGVAHEVRNPLCGITTTLSAMARRLEDKEAARPFVEVVLKEADHLNHLMEQLLEHSRPNRIENHPAGVESIIAEAIRERRAQFADKGVALELDCPANLPGVHLDYRKMHGVFANLLDNALQHTAPGGRVAVRVSTDGDDVAGANNGGRGSGARAAAGVRIELSDTGSGIAPADLARIFEPFYTTRTTGTGLGLAIVRKAVHDHGGQITALSELGKGTQFRISLPLESNLQRH